MLSPRIESTLDQLGLSLNMSAEVEASTAAIYAKIEHLVPEMEWILHAPMIHAIECLKREKNAIILAHNYMTPQIFHGVGDICGDSLALARRAAEVDAETIVMAGVHFMAETAKLVNPAKKILIPDPEAGCSLAESITAADIRKLRTLHPGVPVVTYVNTSAEVKAETDICCTSGNAVKVVESLGVDRVIFLPDEYLAQNIAKLTEVEIITWPGRCMVHEQFTPGDLQAFRDQFPDIRIIAHPECSPEVVDVADMAGSTAQMIDYVAVNRPKRVAMITECSMSDNVAGLYPDVEFIRPCNACPHMKKITLENIIECLVEDKFVVEIDEAVADRARMAVERMLAIGRNDAITDPEGEAN